MARLARVVVPGVPHHVTQRGNRRQQTFFSDEDYRAYKGLMAEWCGRSGVEIWAYCLMPNHVHLICVPQTADALTRAVSEAHRRYTRRVNFREGWRGHLWQGRFASFPMDEAYLLAAARYVELNPVRAGLTDTPESWPWSSARSHLAGGGDDLIGAPSPLTEVDDWRGFLNEGLAEDDAEAIRAAERTGRPLGGDAFIAMLEGKLKRSLKKGKPGPKRGGAR
ncbi:MAG: transposase [Rhodospirillales bacterium]|nr:transposase [Rhodospirillales bacterium]